MKDDQAILDASLQITIFSEDGSYYDQGMGTLVNVNGATLIVTHNHWTFRDFLEKFQKALILNARNEQLVELTLRDFMSLILFSDPGTLILQAPAVLKNAPANLGNFPQAKTGDSVTMVHREASYPNQLELQAEIREINSYNGSTVYYLVTKNGEKIMRGDSGGGVWLDGQLLANSWAIFDEKGSLFQKATRVTIAAQFPETYLQFAREFQAGPLAGAEPPTARHWDIP